jgi:PmbA protein
LPASPLKIPAPACPMPNCWPSIHQQPDLDLYHPWLLSVEAGVELARRCEQAAFAVSPQISNSEGATVSIQEGQFVSANSLGFIGGYPSSRHYLSCSVIAGKNESMQRDDWYSVARDPLAIGSAESIGEQAARRALSRLGARKVKTCKVPVIFEAPLAASLIGNFVHAVSGGSLYRRPPSWSIAWASASFRRRCRSASDRICLWAGKQLFRQRRGGDPRS